MRLLLDEALPRQLAGYLEGHEAQTVEQQGWKGFGNGRLLRLAAAADFHVFVTADQNLQYQQNLAQSEIAVVVLEAVSNRLADLLPLIPALLDALPSLAAGELRTISR